MTLKKRKAKVKMKKNLGNLSNNLNDNIDNADKTKEDETYQEINEYIKNEGFNDYLAAMHAKETWAGQTEIEVICEYLNLQIRMIKSRNMAKIYRNTLWLRTEKSNVDNDSLDKDNNTQ